MAHALNLSSRSSSSTQQQQNGRVVRLAARQFHPQHSKPSSREYTTRKDELESLQIQTTGCVGDYNHYRTVALQSTVDRAVSLLTCDVVDNLRTLYPDVKEGDLGENLLVDGVSFPFFQVGCRYCFDSSSSLLSLSDNNIVILEITERVQPCANLCKLSYINYESLTPKERIQKCQDFILHLDQQGDGYRGWYAKVIQEGTIAKGATVTKLLL